MTQKVQDIFGASPKTVLNKPYMHARQISASNNGGTSVVGANDRVLDTLEVNEIAGASLANNEITLPAGSYYIKSIQGWAENGNNTTPYVAATIRNVSTDEVLLRSIGGMTSNRSGGWSVGVEGRLVLSVQTTIKLTTYTTSAEPVGLGYSYPFADNIHVHSECYIWQLDATVQTPVLVNDKLYPLPGNTLVTGNMHGLEYEYTSANSITVQPGICMDSTNTEVLSAASSQVVSIPSVINTIYNLFLCDDGVVRTDTDVNGVSLGAYSIRWIGFVLTDASGVLYVFRMSGDNMCYTDQAVLSSTATITKTAIDFSNVMPISRVSALSCTAYNAGGGADFAFWYTSEGGVMLDRTMINNPPTESAVGYSYVTGVFPVDEFYSARCNEGTIGICPANIKLKR